jgi:phage/plasmid-associated DNA primase
LKNKNRGNRRKLIFNRQNKSFYAYNEIKGIWELKSDSAVQSVIADTIMTIKDKKLNSRLLCTKVFENLKGQIGQDQFPKTQGLATRKGFFSYKTGSFIPHSPDNMATHFIDHELSDEAEMDEFFYSYFSRYV